MSEQAGPDAYADGLEIEEHPLESKRLMCLTLSGSLGRETSTKLHTKLHGLRTGRQFEQVELDCAAVTRIDSAGIAVLSLFARLFQEVDISFRVTRLSPTLKKILAIMPQKPKTAVVSGDQESALESLGSSGLRGWVNVQQFYATLTDTALAAARVLGGRSPPRGAVTTQAVRIGVDALPIVGLLSFLLGLVLAFQSADQLREFGAEIYTANLVGIGMFREFGALLTGIVLAGRSGSSIAAELGTMRVNEEIDALHAMGIDHNRFLVLPRMLAIVLVQPALTLMSNLIGAFGGLIIGVLYLRIPAAGYLHQSFTAVQIHDLSQGLSKGLIFALLIGSIACFSGLSVSGGSTEVGRATTRAVVASIFMIIVADSILTTISTLFG